MNGFVELIRKIVVIVLLLEVLLQLQPGKDYDAYIKVFVGLIILLCIVGNLQNVLLDNVDFSHCFKGYISDEYGVEKSDFVEHNEEISVGPIVIDKVQIERVEYETRP